MTFEDATTALTDAISNSDERSVDLFADGILTIDPRRSFGAPIFVRGAARLTDVLQRLAAGESIYIAAAEFGVPVDHLVRVIAVADWLARQP